MQIYSVGEIATAAGVPVSQVADRVLRAGIPTSGGYVGEADAVALVRSITSAEPLPSTSPTFASVVVERERRGVFGLLTSSALHLAAGTVLILSSFAWLSATADEPQPAAPPVHLVFFMKPGPSGGGGGGGLKIPAPARRAQRMSPAPRPVSSPVPEVRKPPPPPEPKPEPKVEPPPPPPSAPVVQAPVVPKPADPVDTAGVLTPPPAPRPANQGSGAGGGAGTGSGTGIGQGSGPGIGPGTGGGEGGGPYRPGAGIDPPTLQRETKALYTDDARRRGVEGEVLLEIVVRSDGSVGDVRIKRSLDRGLDQRAVDAVRQWRFTPARRRGVPVDVIAEVSVEFKLR